MEVKDGTTVAFVIHRIPLDTNLDFPVCASSELGGKPSPSTPIVSINVFHERISGSVESADLRTSPPRFFEVLFDGTRRCFTLSSDVTHYVHDVLQLDESEKKDLDYIISFTTTKKHYVNNTHLTNFRLNKKHWEWEFETAGEVQITPSSGDGLLVHATVWNESTLSIGNPLDNSVLGDGALDPADEDEFGGIRHRKRIPAQRDDE